MLHRIVGLVPRHTVDKYRAVSSATRSTKLSPFATRGARYPKLPLPVDLYERVRRCLHDTAAPIDTPAPPPFFTTSQANLKTQQRAVPRIRATRPHTVIIDSSPIVYRSYYSLPPLTVDREDGTTLPIHAVFGYMRILMKLMREWKFDNIIVCADSGGRNFRKEIYQEYKGKRKPVDNDLRVQFPLIEEATRALNIPYVGIRGIEADDLIATYAKQAREEGHRVTIVTPDKDMLQLALNGHVRVYDPQREVYSDRNTVILKHGISPEQFPELQALIGDTVDNIPKVKGMGPQTAKGLIKHFGSVENLLANLDQLENQNHRNLLESHIDMIRLNIQLVRLMEDVEVPIQLADTLYKRPDPQTLLDFLERYKFNSIIKFMDTNNFFGEGFVLRPEHTARIEAFKNAAAARRAKTKQIRTDDEEEEDSGLQRPRWMRAKGAAKARQVEEKGGDEFEFESVESEEVDLTASVYSSKVPKEAYRSVTTSSSKPVSQRPPLAAWPTHTAAPVARTTAAPPVQKHYTPTQPVSSGRPVAVVNTRFIPMLPASAVEEVEIDFAAPSAVENVSSLENMVEEFEHDVYEEDMVDEGAMAMQREVEFIQDATMMDHEDRDDSLIEFIDESGLDSVVIEQDGEEYYTSVLDALDYTDGMDEEQEMNYMSNPPTRRLSFSAQGATDLPPAKQYGKNKNKKAVVEAVEYEEDMGIAHDSNFIEEYEIEPEDGVYFVDSSSLHTSTSAAVEATGDGLIEEIEAYDAYPAKRGRKTKVAAQPIVRARAPPASVAQYYDDYEDEPTPEPAQTIEVVPIAKAPKVTAAKASVAASKRIVVVEEHDTEEPEPVEAASVQFTRTVVGGMNVILGPSTVKGFSDAQTAPKVTAEIFAKKQQTTFTSSFKPVSMPTMTAATKRGAATPPRGFQDDEPTPSRGVPRPPLVTSVEQYLPEPDEVDAFADLQRATHKATAAGKGKRVAAVAAAPAKIPDIFNEEDTAGQEVNIDYGDGTEDVIEEMPSIQKIIQVDQVFMDRYASAATTKEKRKLLESQLVGKVTVVNDEESAKAVLQQLYTLKDAYHAFDTEAVGIDVKKESPASGVGRVICASLYCGPEFNFGNGPRIWIDNQDLSEGTLLLFKGYLENPEYKKVLHNFTFDYHMLNNHGIICKGLGGDTIHMARLWNSSRRGAGSYSLEGLSNELLGDRAAKSGMKTRFGRKRIKKDGGYAKVVLLPALDELQRDPEWVCEWIDYSTLDAEATWHLREEIEKELKFMPWYRRSETMWDFYKQIWLPFAEVLADMERRGIKIDIEYLQELAPRADADRIKNQQKFQEWATMLNPDCQYMNPTSDAQKQHLLFAPCINPKTGQEMPEEREFLTENTEGYVEPDSRSGKPKKKRGFVIRGLGLPFTDVTMSGWPAVSQDVLQRLAGDPPNRYGELKDLFEKKGYEGGAEACVAIASVVESSRIETLLNNFIGPLSTLPDKNSRIHCSMNLNTETGRLSARKPNLQNQPAHEKDRYKIRRAFVAEPGNVLIVADYGQLELRLLAHITKCKSMLTAFREGGDFHSRTAMGMYPEVEEAIAKGEVLLEWDVSKGPAPKPLLKDVFGMQRRRAKTLNFSIAYGKTVMGLAKDWGVSRKEAKDTLERWYRDRPEVKRWQWKTIKEAHETGYTRTLLGRYRPLPDIHSKDIRLVRHSERASINTPLQGGAADIVTKAMVKIFADKVLRDLGYNMLLQVHDELIFEGPEDHAKEALARVVELMSNPLEDKLLVDLVVDAKVAKNWYEAK